MQIDLKIVALKDETSGYIKKAFKARRGLSSD